VNVVGNAATLEKYKDILMNVMFLIRYQSGENQSHQDQLRKTARKTKPSWNHYAWMSNIDVSKLDYLRAAYEWFLFFERNR